VSISGSASNVWGGPLSEDRKFADLFLLILGVLFMISIGVFVLSREISNKKFGDIVRADSAYQDELADRIKPVGRILLPGEVSEAEAVAAVAAATPVAEMLTGPQVYNQACLACHGAGVAGAPVVGDAEAWASRIAQGIDLMREHAVNGYQGAVGYMPPKGGRLDLSDQEVFDAIDYIIAESQ